MYLLAQQFFVDLIDGYKMKQMKKHKTKNMMKSKFNVLVKTKIFKQKRDKHEIVNVAESDTLFFSYG